MIGSKSSTKAANQANQAPSSKARSVSVICSLFAVQRAPAPKGSNSLRFPLLASLSSSAGDDWLQAGPLPDSLCPQRATTATAALLPSFSPPAAPRLAPSSPAVRLQRSSANSYSSWSTAPPCAHSCQASSDLVHVLPPNHQRLAMLLLWLLSSVCRAYIPATVKRRLQSSVKKIRTDTAK